MTLGARDLGGRAAADPGSVPPPAPMDMPTQSFELAPERPARERPGAATLAARIVAFGGATALTIFGAGQMRLVFGDGEMTLLQSALLVFFTVTFAWIALSACQTLAAIFPSPRERGRRAGATPAKPPRTVVVMPVYNEDPTHTCAALHALGEGLTEPMGDGSDGAFEIFILSDTRRSEVWVRETAAYAWLADALGSRLPVWYRRRDENAGRKAGNLRAFVERWGGRYDFMLVLDADSVMDPGAVREMVRRMQASPRLGILQTVPMLCGGETLFARLQQFAGRLYGPVVARGVAAWQGLDGNYWGHNALIRVSAFAQSCGLPELPGRKPFGGGVMSHDFVEAALIRRAGWTVRMDTDLGGSWEGAPPSLLDLAKRDRRWAQGNLQHMKVIGARGLRSASRVHFLIGVGAYLMSPLWLLMLLTGMALTAQSLIYAKDYFPDAIQLFPVWPVFDSVRMMWLFALTMGLLLAPKLVGILRAVLIGSLRRTMGGPVRILAGSLLEIILSALYAPVLMLLQIRQFIEILSGRDSGWATQSRAGAAMPWGAAFRRHWRHMAAGLIPGAAIVWLAPEQLIWLSPVLAGLLAAPALSRVGSDPRAGAALARAGLMITPEETAPPSVFQRAARSRAELEPLLRLEIADLATDDRRLARHLRTVATEKADTGSGRDLDQLTARAKIEAAKDASQALDWMTAAEVVALLSSPPLLKSWASKGARRNEPTLASVGG